MTLFYTDNYGKEFLAKVLEDNIYNLMYAQSDLAVAVQPVLEKVKKDHGRIKEIQDKFNEALIATDNVIVSLSTLIDQIHVKKHWWSI